MEINTGDVIPLFDDELDILEDDKLARQAVPVLAPVSEREPTRLPVKARPASKGAPAPVRRPNKEATPSIEAMETMVTTSLAAREQVSEAGYSEAFLYVEKGPGAGQLVPVLQGELTIGRSSESGLQLNHPSVSRLHAVLVRRAEQYYLTDKGSQNGTYVNWAKIRGEVEVFPGDQISIGSAVVVLRGGVYTSAMRRGGTGVVETPPMPRWMIGGAIGLGFLAAVGLGVGVAVMLSSKKPVVAAVPLHPAAVAAAAPRAVEAKPAPKAVEAPKAEAKPEPVKVAEVAKPAPKVEPVKVAAEPSRHESRHERASKKHHEKASRQVASADTSDSSGGDAPEAVLKVYETGNVEAAISAAEQANATRLATKMKQFKSAYGAAKDALANKDGGGAVSNFNKALKLDEQIDSGWGKLNGEIRGELANLYVLAGNQAMGRGETDTAIKAFKAAQGYQPANAEARSKLKQLQGGAAKAHPAADSKSAADAAFDN